MSSAHTKTPTGNARIALAQVAPMLGDRGRNLTMHERQIAEARSAGADLVVFPELSLTGYFLRDMVPEVGIPIDSPEINRLLAAADSMDVVFGFVVCDVRFCVVPPPPSHTYTHSRDSGGVPCTLTRVCMGGVVV